MAFNSIITRNSLINTVKSTNNIAIIYEDNWQSMSCKRLMSTNQINSAEKKAYIVKIKTYIYLTLELSLFNSETTLNNFSLDTSSG